MRWLLMLLIAFHTTAGATCVSNAKYFLYFEKQFTKEVSEQLNLVDCLAHDLPMIDKRLLQLSIVGREIPYHSMIRNKGYTAFKPPVADRTRIASAFARYCTRIFSVVDSVTV
jgi:hypothetical protein